MGIKMSFRDVDQPSEFPKNLNQLMKVAKNFTFTMLQNDWAPNGKLINWERTVVAVSTRSINFSGGSHLHFDQGAAGVKFEEDKLIVDLTGDNSFKEKMTYQLKPINTKRRFYDQTERLWQKQ